MALLRFCLICRLRKHVYSCFSVSVQFIVMFVKKVFCSLAAKSHETFTTLWHVSIRRCRENEASFLVWLSSKRGWGMTGSFKQLCWFLAPLENTEQVWSTGQAWNEVNQICNQKNLVISLCGRTKLKVILSGLKHNFISQAFWVQHSHANWIQAAISPILTSVRSCTSASFSLQYLCFVPREDDTGTTAHDCLTVFGRQRGETESCFKMPHSSYPLAAQDHTDSNLSLPPWPCQPSSHVPLRGEAFWKREE